MKVKKSSHANEPGYPNRRQFSECGKLAGIAAIGFGALVGGCDRDSDAARPTRTMGIVMEEPGDQRQTPQPPGGMPAPKPSPETPAPTPVPPPPAPDAKAAE